MSCRRAKPVACPIHGSPTHRKTCKSCNAVYMRGYMRRRRAERPDMAMWQRARERAQRQGMAFSLPSDAVVVPQKCPVLGMPLKRGKGRSSNSPSLDRIRPGEGYIPGNVRVISDHANRLKGDRSHRQLIERAERGRRALREAYAQVAAYVEREMLLMEIRQKAAEGGPGAQQWEKIAEFLDRVFQKGFGT